MILYDQRCWLAIGWLATCGYGETEKKACRPQTEKRRSFLLLRYFVLYQLPDSRFNYVFYLFSSAL